MSKFAELSSMLLTGSITLNSESKAVDCCQRKAAHFMH